MARDFTKNLSNYLALGDSYWGALINGAAGFSFHAWVWADSFDTAQLNNQIATILISADSAGLIVCVGSSPAKLTVRARRQSGGTAFIGTGTTTITTGAWWSVGGTVDLPGETISPYVNGVAEGVNSAATFGGGTYIHASGGNSDAIGAYRGTTQVTADQWDGLIAYPTLWNVLLTAKEMRSLGQTWEPWAVRPQSIVSSLRLWGDQSTEIDDATGVAHTPTGTLARAKSPPLIFLEGTESLDGSPVIPPENILRQRVIGAIAA